jgi:hypothetical protein
LSRPTALIFQALCWKTNTSQVLGDFLQTEPMCWATPIAHFLDSKSECIINPDQSIPKISGFLHF